MPDLVLILSLVGVFSSQRCPRSHWHLSSQRSPFPDRRTDLTSSRPGLWRCVTIQQLGQLALGLEWWLHTSQVDMGLHSKRAHIVYPIYIAGWDIQPIPMILYNALHCRNQGRTWTRYWHHSVLFQSCYNLNHPSSWALEQEAPLAYNCPHPGGSTLMGSIHGQAGIRSCAVYEENLERGSAAVNDFPIWERHSSCPLVNDHSQDWRGSAHFLPITWSHGEGDCSLSTEAAWDFSPAGICETDPADQAWTQISPHPCLENAA